MNAALRFAALVSVAEEGASGVVTLDGADITVRLLLGYNPEPGDIAWLVQEGRRMVAVGYTYTPKPIGTKWVDVAEDSVTGYVDVYPKMTTTGMWLFVQALGGKGVHAIVDPTVGDDHFRVRVWYDDPAVEDERRWFHYLVVDPDNLGDVVAAASGIAEVPVASGQDSGYLDVDPGAIAHQDYRLFVQALGGKGVYAICDQSLSADTFRITVWYDNPAGADEIRYVNWMLI